MYFRFLIITAFGVLCANSVVPGPRFPPTKGEVWPKPQFQRKEEDAFLLVPSLFNIIISNHNCDILRRAVERYSFTLRSYASIARWSKEVSSKKGHERSGNSSSHWVRRPHLKELEIDLNLPCEAYPYMDMEESYLLTVNQSSYLRSSSIWGILRGLESFSHLFYLTDDYTAVLINSTEILDFPRYKHRGLLLDTSRHYISMSNILKTLNAMSMNKLNVFHWHIVDDESFPYQSERFPDLSANGAFHPSMIYSKADIQTVIQYATDRGIRVIPEFDVPGHTRSWGETFPTILTKCYKDNKVDGLGPMDPTSNDTYTVLKDLLNEVQAIFPDKYIHVGGDEVNLGCWSSNPDLIEYMKKHNFTQEQLHGIFMEKVLPLLKANTTAIVWQEVFDEKVPLNKDVLVQIWKSNYLPKITEVLLSGHKALFSAAWYLDSLKQGGDWQRYYSADPRDMVKGRIDDSLLSNIVGGEACMWGEVVDDSNVISRVWPRASAVAERLWSSSTQASELSYKDVIQDAVHRLEEHYCRMRRRGVAAQPPNGPGVCVTHMPK